MFETLFLTSTAADEARAFAVDSLEIVQKTYIMSTTNS